MEDYLVIVCWDHFSWSIFLYLPICVATSICGLVGLGVLIVHILFKLKCVDRVLIFGCSWGCVLVREFVTWLYASCVSARLSWLVFVDPFVMCWSVGGAGVFSWGGDLFFLLFFLCGVVCV